MRSIRQHPFPVEAFFEKSIVLAFAVPKQELAKRVPEFLELDLLDDRWAFLAAALVRTKDLRPRGFPKLLGTNFILIGYRIFVRYASESGRRLRGLYILGSETDKWRMKFFGNIFTQYQYGTVSTRWDSQGETETIESSNGLRVVAGKAGDKAALPTTSPFSDWREARRFAGPMPYTFSKGRTGREVVIVEGVRSNWTPLPLEIAEWNVPFFGKFDLEGICLANAFMIEKVPYQWKRGRVEEWSG